MTNQERNLNQYEEIDIEKGLYSGWDINGFPLKVIWNEKKRRPQVVITEQKVQLDKLKAAILEYAKFGRPDVPFKYSGSENDVVGLFTAVENHLKEGKSWFSRLFHRW